MKFNSARLFLLAPVLVVLAACGSTRSADVAVKPYPLNTCLVMGSPLGSMGDPVVKVYEGQEVKFCCQSCVTEFEANPDKYLAKLNTKK